MDKKILFISLMMLLLFPMIPKAQSVISFPYFNEGTNSNGFTTLSSNGGLNYSADGIRLTNTTSQFTGIKLNGISFATSDGFDISFEFDMFGGTQVYSKNADGIALVIFDGSIATPGIGAAGNSLGYTNSGPSSNANPGMQGALLGIGLDEYGEFKARIGGNSKYRNGVNTSVGSNAKSSQVVVRGPVGDNRYTGYPVLVSRRTASDEDKFVLDYSNGNYSSSHSSFSSITGNTFELRGGASGVTKDPSSPAYRKVFLRFLAGKSGTADGYYLNLDIQHGTTRTNLFKDFFIPTTSIQYMEATSSTGNSQKTLSTSFPATFSLGFTASTGGASQTQYVRNIRVSVPFAAISNDDIISGVCKNTATTFDPLTNDLGYNSNQYMPGAEPEAKEEYVDAGSFQFKALVNGVFQDVTGNTYTSAYGTYTYNYVLQTVTFVPNSTLINSANTTISETIYYNINNKAPLNGSNYRSMPSKITLNFSNSPCETNVITNQYIIQPLFK
ncbi:L-type lectin family protein [Dysgonomonas sp.]